MADTDIRISRKAFGVALLLMNLYPVYLVVAAARMIPPLEKSLVELALNEPLPFMTSVLFATRNFLWAAPLVSIALTVAVLVRRKSGSALATAAVVATFAASFGLLGLLTDGSMVPILGLIQKMGE